MERAGGTTIRQDALRESGRNWALRTPETSHPRRRDPSRRLAETGKLPAGVEPENAKARKRRRKQGQRDWARRHLGLSRRARSERAARRDRSRRGSGGRADEVSWRNDLVRG
jgi:hypothetical protein